MLAAGSGQIASMADQMGRSYGMFGSGLRSAYDGTQAGLNNNYQQTYAGINNLWNNSLGRTRQFMSEADKARDDIEAGDVRRDAYTAARARAIASGARRVPAALIGYA
jgi:hypothetical protein